VLTPLLAYLIQIIKLQQQFILILLTQLANIYTHSRTPRLEGPTYHRFNQFKADDKLPLLQAQITHEQLDYRELLTAHLQKYGRPLRPINRRKPFKYPNISCPRCQAPNGYLYANGGGQQALVLCKVCEHGFNPEKRYAKELVLRCPDCQRQLSLYKQRVKFKVWRCQNLNCPHRLAELAKLTPDQQQLYQHEPSQFKLRYTYRDYDFNIHALDKSSPIRSRVDLSRIQASPKVLGTILTYYVNYGLSAAKTAALMYDIHQVKISKQTVLNYAEAVGKHLRPFLDDYPYQLSTNLVGDETYLRVKGKWHYLFYFYDATRKIILADYVTPQRTTESACIAIYEVLKRYQQIPDNLEFTVDDNPIYRVARLHYAQNEGIDFDLNIVKGLTNETEVAKEYRPAKQTIERLNRSFKLNYRPMGGFHSTTGSVTYVTLYSACHNFLMPHQSLAHQVPVPIPEVLATNRMPDKWRQRTLDKPVKPWVKLIEPGLI
jgi:transposase-like protein/ribosomal protein L37AE/L43A